MTAMLVVQPHLDDAVLGAWRQIMDRVASKLVVATAFSGTPSRYPPLSKRPHDDICGFRRGEDVMSTRRAEDRQAIEMMGGRVVHMGMLDSQYLGEMAVDQVRPNGDRFSFHRQVEAEWETCGRPVEVWCPAGVAHPDHMWVLQQMVEFCTRRDVRLRCWLEPGYRSRYPELAGKALAALVDQTDTAIPWMLAATKLAAIRCYVSQMHALSSLSLIDALTVETVGTWAATA